MKKPTIKTCPLTTKWLYVIAIIGGLLQAFAFDFPFNSSVTFLAPIASFISLLIFLFAVVRLSVKRGLLFAYLFGLAFFGWGLNWVYISMATYGKAPLPFAIFANVAVIAYLSLYWLVAALFILKLGKTTNQRLLLAAPVIALLEWVRSVFIIGFPWLSIGYAWVDTPIANLASFGGVFFVSFIVVLSASLCLLKIKPLHKNLLLLKVGILLAIVCFPFANIQSISNKTTVALVQGNMPVITQYNANQMNKNLIQYQLLTEKTVAENTDIDAVIWAETAIPYFYQDARPFLDDIHRLQQEKQFDLISGVPTYTNEKYYNAIVFQAKTETPIASFYKKQHLLPFGEYTPLRGLLNIFKDYVQIPMADFSRGEVVQQPFTIGLNRFAPSICFEAVFGDEIRQNAQNADVLLNISNDAWFGKSKAQSQHLNIARMRAIENQKYLIRATNNGITAVIAPNGSVEKSLPPFEEGVLTASVIGNDKNTLYSKIGDMPYVIFFALWGLIIWAVSVFYSHKRKANT
ncbi:MAG: apolipoprotein N-acyltransferase [Gammaproteobacteria bacterium]|nr:apolipoprotein N-acyltransferase [Gammaproteobacteria bacterium]